MACLHLSHLIIQELLIYLAIHQQINKHLATEDFLLQQQQVANNNLTHYSKHLNLLLHLLLKATFQCMAKGFTCNISHLYIKITMINIRMRLFKSYFFDQISSTGTKRLIGMNDIAGLQ